jgi:hypothetical protein
MNVCEHRPPLKRIDYALRRIPVGLVVAEDVYTRAASINRERNIWDAVTATAQASQQGETRE